MSSKECFGVVVRTIGIFILFAGVAYFYSGIISAVMPEVPHSSSTIVYFVAAIVVTLVGLYFLRGIPGLMGWCYPEEKN